MSVLLVALLVALLLDRWLGEPRRYHPLVGFGFLAGKLERRLNRTGCSPLGGRLRGLLALVLLLTLAPLLIWLVQWGLALFSLSIDLWGLGLFSSRLEAGAPGEISRLLAELLLAAGVLYLVIGGRSLSEHAQAVGDCLQAGDLQQARRRVGYMVSRDTAELSETQVSKATLESVLENGSDALFAPIFWFVLAGPLAALAYRLINTLDAMWGYRSERYCHFGWAAAKLDDLVNYLPARLCALTYSLLAPLMASLLSTSGLMGSGLSRSGPTGSGSAGCGWRAVGRALHAWSSQAPACESPNAGPVMATGAAALGVTLGGSAVYRGSRLARPLLGIGPSPESADIPRALRLVRFSLWLWVVLIALLILGLGA